MNIDQDHSPESRDNKPPSRDRHDWISKYLDLADKVIDRNMQDRPAGEHKG